MAGDTAIFLASTANLACVLSNVGILRSGTAYFPYVNADDKGRRLHRRRHPVDDRQRRRGQEVRQLRVHQVLREPENQAYWNSITGYFPSTHAQETDTFKANI